MKSVHLAGMVCLIIAFAPASSEAGYWNVFNIEGESSVSANIVTYATLTDMLIDSNRTGVFIPNSQGFGRNIIGSGSDVLASNVVVPEPSTFALLVIGNLALAGINWRRKRGQSARNTLLQKFQPSA